MFIPLVNLTGINLHLITVKYFYFWIDICVFCTFFARLSRLYADVNIIISPFKSLSLVREFILSMTGPHKQCKKDVCVCVYQSPYKTAEIFKAVDV